MGLLKNKKAEGYIFPCVITVILGMIAAVVIYFISTVYMIKNQKEDVKKVLDSFVVENAIEIYNSIKVGEDEQLYLDSTAFIGKLTSFSHLNKGGNTLYSYDSDGVLRYKLSKPILTADNDLKITASYTLYVPVYFNGILVATATIPIRINSYYTEKF